MFPQRLDSSLAYDIAKAMMDGFNRHYRLFRTESARAKHRFETADWHGQQRAQRERIEFYDLRVRAASTRLEREYKAGEQPMDIWHQVKLHYIGLLVDHHQPELAETFFNSVTTKILHRTHFHNDFIFVRPAVSTEYIEDTAPEARPTYRAYYPTPANLPEMLQQMVQDFDLRLPFEDLPRDAALVAQALKRVLGEAKLRANFQVQVLTSLFFRNKGAYIVGKLINGFTEFPFALPILHVRPGEKLAIDAALLGEDDLLMLFSFARAYFMVDMEIPSAYVQFLRSMMPRKPRNEIYNALGLAKFKRARFLLASTSEVYGDPLEHPQTESYWGNVNPIGERSCYDEGKRAAECLTFDYRREHGLDVRVCRIFNTYGPRMALDDGRVVSNFVAQALTGQPMTVYGDGQQTRSFQYVSDLIAGMVAVMEGTRDILVFLFVF